ncbi:MAG: lipopolysaccharide heptosyltransferase family protein [Magnetospirillum sp. WYHS-4]
MRAGAFLADAHAALKRRLRARPDIASGVLLLSCGGLGDTVLFALVLPRFLELAGPGETVTVLLRKESAKMAFLFPSDVGILAVDFGRLARDPAYRLEILDGLYLSNHRLVVHTDHLRHPLLDEVLVAACRAPETAAMEPRSWPKHDRALARNRRLYGKLVDGGALHLDKVVRWARFADALTGRTVPPPRVRLPETRLAPPAAFAAPTVLIQPFSAVALKQSPPSLYETILDTLPAGFRVLLLGAPGDLKRSPEFEVLLERHNLDLDTSPFADLVPKLRAARLVISADTALMHLAVAVGAPTLCLASAAYVDEIVPYAAEITPPNIAFLWHDMPCRGCLGACGLPAEDGMYPCVARLDRRAILAAVAERIVSTNAPA